MQQEESSHDRNAISEAVSGNPLWYHTMELAPGVVTPGRFDVRPVVDKLPWPDLRGKRCLDIGTYDGYFAFEMERRGASAVVATDIASHEDWDWPPVQRARGPAFLASFAGEKGSGFEIAAKALGSRVEKRDLSAYELSPDTVGMFDFVFCGSLLLHLRDPMRALEAMRSVCSDLFLSSEQIDMELTLMHPRSPLIRFNGLSITQWNVPNVAAHRRMVRAAGFEILRKTRPYSIRFGATHPQSGRRTRERLVRTVGAGGDGVPHAAVLARAV